MTLDEVFDDLVVIVSEVGAQVDVPREAATFFTAIAAGFDTREDFLRYAKEHARTWFVSIAGPPDWLQESEWAFDDGKPMVFVGHLDVPASAGYMHDDARFFLFWNPENGTTKSVIQTS